MSTTLGPTAYTEEDRADMAMTVVLTSFAMLFASLFLMYAVYRNANSIWPPTGFEKVSLLIPALSTFIIILSSYTIHRSIKIYAKGEIKFFKLFFVLSIFLGFLFVASQLLLWQNMELAGLYVESGVFASVLYAFTWIHAAHMGLGLIALFYCLPALKKKNKDIDYSLRLKNSAKFWHFLDIVWIIMFVVLFVI